MDQVYIDALVNQALGAYKAGGDEGLEHWKKGLPAHNRKEFEEHCSERLQGVIEALQVEWAQQTEAVKGPDLSFETWLNEVGRAGNTSSSFLGNKLDILKEWYKNGWTSVKAGREITKDVRKKHTRDRRRTKPL